MVILLIETKYNGIYKNRQWISLEEKKRDASNVIFNNLGF